jgi:hypothetical protein
MTNTHEEQDCQNPPEKHTQKQRQEEVTSKPGYLRVREIFSKVKAALSPIWNKRRGLDPLSADCEAKMLSSPLTEH